MVLGMERIADAKMTGITPLMVTLIGQERALTAVNLSANDLLSILHRNAALGIVHENDDPK